MLMESRIIQVGNSRGIRIPKRLILKYGLEDTVVLRETEQGILIEKDGDGRLSWAETYREMARSGEDWSDWADLDLQDIE